jgi:KDO2-lipid IV(A) lauroyltransferase
LAIRLGVAGLKIASVAARSITLGISSTVAEIAGRTLGDRVADTSGLQRNLRSIGVADPGAASRRAIGYYARYWVDTLRLPTVSAEVLDRRFSFAGYDHIREVQRRGHTPIMVLPHLGSWEWAAAWLGRICDQHVIAVVERLEPPELFDWFAKTRNSYGVEIVPLGSGAMERLMTAARDRAGIITLVADRDIAGNGIPVRFFGAEASLPAGPAILGLRTNSPLLPVAVYDTGRTRSCEVRPPIWPDRSGGFRADVLAMTQRVASELEDLISAAPEQWHVLADIWPPAATTSRR